MGKRLAETTRWQDPYFRPLSPPAKLAYIFMLDLCDISGVYDPDWGLANYCIGLDIHWDDVLEELGDRVRKLRNGKIWLSRFCRFQGGPDWPKSGCVPHEKMVRLLRHHGIPLEDALRERDEGETTKKPNKPVQGELDGLKKTRERDLIFEMLAEIQGIDISRLTVSARGRLNKAACEIRNAEPSVTPERIMLAARVWKKKYSAPVTASTLASHWSELTPPVVSQEQREAIEKAQEKAKRDRKRLEELSDPHKAVTWPRADLTKKEFDEFHALKKTLSGNPAG